MTATKKTGGSRSPCRPRDNRPLPDGRRGAPGLHRLPGPPRLQPRAGQGGIRFHPDVTADELKALALAGLLNREGLCIVAVSDSPGRVYSPEGLDVAALEEVKDAARRLPEGVSEGENDRKRLTNGQLLTLAADVLVARRPEGPNHPGERRGRGRQLHHGGG